MKIAFYKRILKMNGFTLMELLIAIAIIGVLTSISIPTYQNYTRKAYFSEIIQATAPYKLGVIECFHITYDLAGCNGGTNGIPADITTAIGGIASLIVKEGAITVAPADKHGLSAEDTYSLTPIIQNNSIAWQVSGGAVAKGYVKGSS